MPGILLRHLLPGQVAKIIKVVAPGELGRRMREMGLVPGTLLKVIGRAPLNDPLEIKVRGYNLTLRNSEAEKIVVKIEK